MASSTTPTSAEAASAADALVTLREVSAAGAAPQPAVRPRSRALRPRDEQRPRVLGPQPPLRRGAAPARGAGIDAGRTPCRRRSGGERHRLRGLRRVLPGGVLRHHQRPVLSLPRGVPADGLALGGRRQGRVPRHGAQGAHVHCRRFGVDLPGGAGVCGDRRRLHGNGAALRRQFVLAHASGGRSRSPLLAAVAPGLQRSHAGEGLPLPDRRRTERGLFRVRRRLARAGRSWGPSSIGLGPTASAPTRTGRPSPAASPTCRPSTCRRRRRRPGPAVPRRGTECRRSSAARRHAAR